MNNLITTKYLENLKPSRKRFHFLLWLLFLIVSLTIFCVQLGLLVGEYNLRDITQITDIRAAEFTWPLITICPRQYIEPTMFQHQLLRSYHKSFHSMCNEWDRAFQQVLTESHHSYYYYHSLIIGYLYHSNMSYQRKLFSNYINRIVGCELKDYPCSFLNFTPYIHPTYYNCFSLSLPTTDVKEYSNFIWNLNITLDLGEEYTVGDRLFHSLNEIRRSFVVIFSERDYRPMLYSQNFEINVDSVATVTVSSKIINKLPVCLGAKEMRQQDMDVYSSKFIQKLLINRCRCYSVLYHITKDVLENKLPICEGLVNVVNSDINDTVDSKTSLGCWYDVMINNQINTYGKELNRCSETLFNLNIYLNKWPTGIMDLDNQIKPQLLFKYNLIKQLNVTGLEMDYVKNSIKLIETITNDNLEKVGNRYLFLKIFAEANRVDVLKEELIYPFPSLLSDLAGGMGIWLGLSVLKIMEIMVSLIKFIYLRCCKGVKSEELN